MKEAFITRTDENCFILGRHYVGLPIIHDEEGQIYNEQTDYLRFLAVHRGLSLGSVYEISKSLKEHLNVMYAQGMEWKETSHEILLHWRNWYVRDKNEQKIKRIINRKLLYIYQFLIWAQDRKLCSEIIGPFYVDDKKQYPVPVKISSVRNDGSAVRVTFPLLYHTLRESDSRNASPQEIDKLFMELANELDSGLAERNILIANWAEGPGLRLHEILALTVKQLPPLEKAKEALRHFHELTMKITVTKGGKHRLVILRPKLVMDTWKYIYNIRNILLDSKKNSPKDVSEVFVSHRSGGALKTNTITRIFSQKQKKLGMSNASIHHLRSIAITNFVRLLFLQSRESGNENPDMAGILLRAKEFAGHAKEATTMKYIRLEQSRNLNFQNKEQEIESNKRQFKKDEEKESRRVLIKNLLN